MNTKKRSRLPFTQMSYPQILYYSQLFFFFVTVWDDYITIDFKYILNQRISIYNGK